MSIHFPPSWSYLEHNETNISELGYTSDKQKHKQMNLYVICWVLFIFYINNLIDYLPIREFTLRKFICGALRNYLLFIRKISCPVQNLFNPISI